MTTPVRYGEHARIAPGTACLMCRTQPERPVMDHCHEHGWTRGVLCMRCNALMASVDRRVMPSANRLTGTVPTEAIAHAHRCPDCPPFDAGDLGSGVMSEAPTTVRFSKGNKAGVHEFAEEMGISFNAAANVLVAEALKARGKHPAPRRDAD